MQAPKKGFIPQTHAKREHFCGSRVYSNQNNYSWFYFLVKISKTVAAVGGGGGGRILYIWHSRKKEFTS